MPEGTVLPRIEACLAPVRVDVAHLARYRELCATQGDPSWLPIAFPHLLATPIHLALLSSGGFPLRLLGLVHVANVIEQPRPVEVGQGGEMVTWLDGYRDTARGQEFDLETEWRDRGVLLWRETCTFLARRRAGGRDSPRQRPAEEPQDTGPVVTSGFRAPAGLGRSYGRVSGDWNPIHLADVTARAFGFRAAIAHGMWALARCAAELPAERLAGAVRYAVDFRLPVLLPAWVTLQRWEDPSGLHFTLRDAQAERVHLKGQLRTLGP
ncbi:MAG: MaoC/PaaZ C-terminal domain-containing protein [Steroidobacteraceae bacterium]